MHVHEDAFVRVAWGRLPFADSRLRGWRADDYWGQSSKPAPWIGIKGKIEIEDM